ncbi:MAG TPA: transglycosylase SLT domain-containing protein [Vicinamibacterales bacterium]|nr:transglycosylase SLT domain-containing protein [Vicinamibacterales bacterium]
MNERTPRTKWLLWPLVASALLITVQAWTGGRQQEPASTAPADSLGAGLIPTAHVPVPARLEAMWYAPSSAAPSSEAVARLARGVQILDEGGDAAEALPRVNNSAVLETAVGDYARYYSGIALQRLDRLDEADAAFAAVAERKRDAQLPESALYRRAEIREARQDFAGAVTIYDQLLARTPASPQLALVRMASAAASAGEPARAIELHRRVVREFALSPEAAEAERLLDGLGGFALDTAAEVEVELGRAEALYNARRFDRAHNAFTRIRGRVTGDNQHRVTLRLAQIEAALGRPRPARDVFRRYVGHAALGLDAQYGMLATARAMGQHSEANALTEDFVARYPDHPRSEEALNEMARRYVLADDDGKAAAVYTRMIDRFPGGAFAERGAWKAGWWAYRTKDFGETIRVFERGATHFPRSDYRPAWLYWTARAYDRMGQRAKAVERYRLTATDYLNSYYGRLAWKRLEDHNEAHVTPGIRRVIEMPPDPPPNLGLVQALITAGLYRPALDELQYAQRVWGDSAPLQGTIGFVHNKMGNLRLGITAMRRAYPQFMAAGGEDLPVEILRTIFPLDYWPLLKGHAQAQGLDPFVVVALVAQESTFDPKIRSSANAIGLMQIIPPTGRRLAKRVGMRNFTERALENPEISARLGTRYFGDMVKEFGGYHYALAGYNAGEHRVRRWNREAPGLPQDEWIDNIPYPETQNYVKRIVGTAEDYRRLYGDGK